MDDHGGLGPLTGQREVILLNDEEKRAPLDERFTVMTAHLQDALNSIIRHQDTHTALLEGNGEPSYKEVRSYVKDLKTNDAVARVKTVHELEREGVWRLVHWGMNRIKLEWIVFPGLVVALILAILNLKG